MQSTLDSVLDGANLSPGQGHGGVFLDKTHPVGTSSWPISDFAHHLYDITNLLSVKSLPVVSSSPKKTANTTSSIQTMKTTETNYPTAVNVAVY